MKKADKTQQNQTPGLDSRMAIEMPGKIDGPTTKDLLGFDRFVKPVSQRIALATNKNTPLTIGIFGEWGSGKTSFLLMVDEALRRHDIYPIWFNAWKYDQEDNLWSALIQSILDQVKISGKWYRRVYVKAKIWGNRFDLRSGVWEILKGLIVILLRIVVFSISLWFIFGWSSSDIESFINRAFVWLFSSTSIRLNLNFIQANIIKACLALIGFLAANPFELFVLFNNKLGIDFEKFQRTRNYRAHIAFLDEFSEEFRRIIKLTGLGKPLVVMIDDLDRCMPEKTIQVLEAIKLFLDVEGCVFLLGIDRKVVENAIAVRYKDWLDVTGDLENHSQLSSLFFENYLEKLIQLPISLPPMSVDQFQDFIAGVYSDKDVTKYAGIFAAGLPRNPRKVKRILQMFLFLRDSMQNDIEHGNLKLSLIAKLVIIQSQFRRFYNLVTATPSLLAGLENHYRNPDKYPFDKIAADPALSQKVEQCVELYTSLKGVLLQGDDTFVGVNIEPYIYFIEPVVEITSSSRISSSNKTPAYTYKEPATDQRFTDDPNAFGQYPENDWHSN